MKSKSAIAWAHGTEVDENGKKLVSCNYCTKVVTSITRLKLHLAKIGKDVTSCPSVPEAVYHEFLQYFSEHPHATTVKPNKNQDLGESSLAGGQSSRHQQISKDAQTKDGGNCQCHKVALPHQSTLFIDLDPDTEVSVKAKREDIDQMVSDMMHDRKMKKKHVDSSSSGNTTSSLEPVQKKARIQMLDFHKPDQALNLCKGKESQPMPGIHTTDSLEFMASIETGRSSCNGYSVPADESMTCAQATATAKNAQTAQKNLSLITKSYKEYRLKVKAQQEQFRKAHEFIGQQLREKVQEVETKNKELESVRAALEAKEKKLKGLQAANQAKQRELEAKDIEMEKLRRGALTAQAEWYVQGREEIIVKAKEVGLNHKLLLPDPAYDPTE